MARLLPPRPAMLAGLLVIALSQAVTGGPEPAHNQDRLGWQDHVLRFSSSSLIAVDWLMTIDARRKGYPESNPLLGRHPPLGKVNLMIGAGLVTNTFMIPMIKNVELRRGIWGAMLLLELYALQANRAAGLRLNFQL